MNSISKWINKNIFNPFDVHFVRHSSLLSLLRNPPHSTPVAAASPPNVTNAAPLDPAGTWVLAEVCDGLRLWLDLGDYGVSRPCLMNAYEPVETSFLRSFLQPGMSFVDIGANIGWFTMIAAHAVGPTGLVYSFEPRPDTFSRLVNSANENHFSWVKSNQIALGSQPGRMVVATLINAHNPGGTWMLATESLNSNLMAGYERFEVDVKRLDSIDIQGCDLLKIDIEGAEFLALQGSQETLKRHRPVIFSEINPEPLMQVSSVSASEYVDFLGSIGYRPHFMASNGVGDPINLKFFDGLNDMVNVVFVPSEKY